MFTPILALHIPDGFLSLPVSLLGWILALGLIAGALRQIRSEISEKQIPMLGILAAFVFAAQMMNFPVVGGTSGHLVGGAIVAILLGPWSAVLVMAVVVAVQALIFHDGGLMALGFNIFNMGIISAFVGYIAYNAVRKILGDSSLGKFVGAGLGAWLGVEIAAIAVALQLAASNTSPIEIALPAMFNIHALIGIGEAIITILVLAFVQRVQPELMNLADAKTQKSTAWIVGGLVIAIIIACFSPLADANPDGLERVAENLGFLHTAQSASYTIFPDYTLPFIGDPALTTIMAGIIGILIVSALGYGIARLSKVKQI